MKKQRRNIAFACLSILLYIGWINGGENIYGKVITTGVNKFTTQFSSIEKAERILSESDNQIMLLFTYPDRTNRIAMEYCLPIILLLAWNLSLFFDFRLNVKTTLKYLSINFIIVYTLQIIFPLLLFNISQSKGKSLSLFIGMQVFGFLVFFLILKDSIIIKTKFSEKKIN